VPPLAALVGRASQQWDPAVERVILGTGEAGQVASIIEAFVSARCGSIDDAVFYRPGVGIVAGLRLSDDTEVVVKIHRWSVSIARLTAIHKVQAFLDDGGLPVPRPLIEPEPLVDGIAIIEELRRGGRASGRDPVVRKALAEGLHAFISAAAPLVGMVDVGSPLLLRPVGAPLWFEPHDVRFDFDDTTAGAEWIDRLAAPKRRPLSGFVTRFFEVRGDGVVTGAGQYSAQVDQLLPVDVLVTRTFQNLSLLTYAEQKHVVVLLFDGSDRPEQ
jgi:hypothetical protein